MPLTSEPVTIRPTAEADRIPVTATRPDGHPAATARPHPGLTRATFLPSNQGERQADMREGPGHHVMSRDFRVCPREDLKLHAICRKSAL